jgi:hypothetical protein
VESEGCANATFLLDDEMASVVGSLSLLSFMIMKSFAVQLVASHAVEETARVQPVFKAPGGDVLRR